MTITTDPHYTPSTAPTLYEVGQRVVALYPNHRWGKGEIVEVRDEEGLKPYLVRSDRTGRVGYFYADGVTREVPADEYAGRTAIDNPRLPDGVILQGLDRVIDFLSDDEDRGAERGAVEEARKRIAAGL